MYSLYVTNRNNERERVYVDEDAYFSEFEPTQDEKNDILIGIIKELEKRNKERGLGKKNRKMKGKEEIVMTRSLSVINKNKKTLIFNERKASDYKLYDDGTYDYNEVKSKNYNDNYFDLNEFKSLL